MSITVSNNVACQKPRDWLPSSCLLSITSHPSRRSASIVLHGLKHVELLHSRNKVFSTLVSTCGRIAGNQRTEQRYNRVHVYAYIFLFFLFSWAIVTTYIPETKVVSNTLLRACTILYVNSNLNDQINHRKCTKTQEHR